MYSTDQSVTDEGLSAVADNLILMRYLNAKGTLRNTLVIVKTRGSAHHGGTHEFKIGRGGLEILGPLAQD
jgi:circadian clock protein KaiC